MGGICSRKRNQQVIEDDIHRGVSGRYCRSGSTKWLRTRSLSSKSNHCPGGRTCPSLMDLCINKIREDFHKYDSLSILPRDISQQIFNELVDSHCLSEASLEAFRDCALQDIDLGEYIGVHDGWMDVISSQGLSLLSVDISGSQVTDNGLRFLKDCTNLQALALNYCDQFSEYGLKHINGGMRLVGLRAEVNGLSNLTSLSIRKSSTVKPDGMRAFSNLFNLEKLDLERCSEIHGGFVHLKGHGGMPMKDENDSLSQDSDMKSISGIDHKMELGTKVATPVGMDLGTDIFLKHIFRKLGWDLLKLTVRELQISNSSITDIGITCLRGLEKLTTLNVEGCNITAACLESIHDSNFVCSGTLASLAFLNLNRCGLSDDGFEKISDLTNLEYLNLDSCRISDDGLTNLTGLTLLKSLVLSDTEIGNSGLRYISGLNKLEDLNLSFTTVTDNGLKRLSGLTHLKSLNLDARQITDDGLANLTTFKNLQSLEICGGGLTDAGVKNIREIVSLTQLNLSQNCNLTDKTLELISGMTALRSLNVSNSRITNEGLRYLKPLKSLRTLTLESCKVTASEIKKLQSTDLPNLISFRPE
ncbi:F-box/LRR-repeat protein 14, partial [Mucuna pruriens]